MKTVLSAMRIQQWYKNLVIFVGIAFSLNLTNPWMFSRVAFAFGVFCVLCSGVYLINDIHDAEIDRLHPVKRNRPVASGKLSMNSAKGLAVLFILVSLVSAYILGDLFSAVCLVYLVQSLFYTFRLKSIVIVDIIVVSTGFVWRAIAGTVIINVETSPWLITCAFLLALFLVLLKREREMATLKLAEEHRTALRSYSKRLIDTSINIATASLLVVYMVYTLQTNHIYMIATIPFAFIGIFRYLQLARQAEKDNPTLLFRDRIIKINLLLWFLTSIVALYDLPSLLIESLSCV